MPQRRRAPILADNEALVRAIGRTLRRSDPSAPLRIGDVLRAVRGEGWPNAQAVNVLGAMIEARLALIAVPIETAVADTSLLGLSLIVGETTAREVERWLGEPDVRFETRGRTKCGWRLSMNDPSAACHDSHGKAEGARPLRRKRFDRRIRAAALPDGATLMLGCSFTTDGILAAAVHSLR